MYSIKKTLLLGAGLTATIMAVQAITSPVQTQEKVLTRPHLLSLESTAQHCRALMAKQHIDPMQMLNPAKQQNMSFQGKRMATTQESDGTTTCYYSCTGQGYDNSQAWMLTIAYNEANGEATLSNLGGFCGELTTQDITATYADGKITLPAITPEGSVENAALLGTYWSMYSVYLACGQFLADVGSVMLESELVLSVSDDKSEISVGGKTLVAVIENQGSIESIDYSRFIELSAIEEGCFTRISTESLDFEQTLPGGMATTTLSLYATGSETANYTISIDNEHFSCNRSNGSVDPCAVKNLTLTFSADEVGEYKGTATLQFGNDTYLVALNATVADAPQDFSSIVTEGDASIFTWNNRLSENAWNLIDGKAIPGNLGLRAEMDWDAYEQDPDNYDTHLYSSVEASYNTENPLSLDFGFCIHDDPTSLFYFYVDGEPLFKYCAQYNKIYRYNCVVPAGAHTLRWTYATDQWCERNAELYLYDMHVSAASQWQGFEGEVPTSAEGWMNLNGQLVSLQADAKLVYDIQTVPSFFSFEAQIDEEAELEVLIDGEHVESLKAENTHFDYNFTVAGSHQVILQTKNDAHVKLIESHIGNGEYTTKTLTCTSIAKSYYDAKRGFSIAGGQVGCYTTTITLYGDGRVSFQDIFPPMSVDETYNVQGRFGADGKIHIANTDYDQNQGTLYCITYGMWGPEYPEYNDNYYLVSGSLDEQEKYHGESEITIAVNADTTQFVVESGMGLPCYYMGGNHGYDINFIQPGTQIFAAGEGLGFNLESIDFGQTSEGIELSRSLMVVNQGEATQYAVSVEGKDKACFTVTPQFGELAQLEFANISIKLNANYAGEYEAKLVISTEDEDYTLPILVSVKGAEDYASIVTEGNDLINWKTEGEYPWHVEDGIATTSNQGVHNSTSTLIANFTVPAGYVATFSYNGDCKMEPDADGFNFFIDRNIAFVESRRNDSICNQFVLEAGDHEVAFVYGKNAYDEYPAAGDYVSIRNVRLHLEPKAADLALQYYYAPLFTELTGVDELAVGDVYLINKGTNDLVLQGIEGDGCFGGMMVPGLTVAPNDTMTVTLVYEPTTQGHHEGTVTLNTSAGNITLPVQANADYVRYLGGDDQYMYSVPYCNLYFMYDIWPIYTQSIYPADWMEGLAGKQIESMTFFSLGASDAPYDCPDSEWQFGETSLERVSEEVMPGLTTVYRGLQPSLVNGELTINFDEPYTYGGGNLMYQCLMHEKELQGGTFFGFPYLGTGSEAEGKSGVWMSVYQLQVMDFIPYMRVKYVGEENPISIDNIQKDSQSAIVSIEYIDANGRKQSGLHTGMNLISVTYADGSHRTSKQLVR